MARGESPIHAPTQIGRTLLVVDDERTLRFTIGEWARDSGFNALEAANGQDALELVRDQSVDLVVLDLKLHNEDGLEVLKRLRDEDSSLPVVMLTGHGGVEHAVRATRLGAYDFILKPPDLDHLGVVLGRALERARLQREVDHWRGGPLGQQNMIGESPGLKKVLQRLDKAARSGGTTVLIRGETGTGKELMALYLHAHGARAQGPF